MGKVYEIRDPIHGFIEFDEWERDIINHPVFQRLRRIRQLSMTDMVYPGAMHTRFEHSLGVMHVAARMFDSIRRKREDFLKSELGFNDAGLDRDRVLVRLAALLHDVGHAPFSHASEELMPRRPNGGRHYKHEDYSAAAVLLCMRDVIENHPANDNYHITAQDVADLLSANTRLRRSIVWSNLVSSQLDADRADYLLRDSHHIGVAYGHYDLNRLLATITVAFNSESSPVLAIEEGGEHAAEGLIIARYMMFTQVYYQKTRRIYDYHSSQAIKHILRSHSGKVEGENGFCFPPPTTADTIGAYLQWDDWRILGMIAGELADEHGRILLERNHYRRVFKTSERPVPEELERLARIRKGLSDSNIPVYTDTASASWYKFENSEISIVARDGGTEHLEPLSRLSSVVGGLKSVEQIRLYVPRERKSDAGKIIDRTQ